MLRRFYYKKCTLMKTEKTDLLKNGQKITMNCTTDLIKYQTGTIEVYLREYCEVNNLNEQELGSLLHVISKETSLSVVSYDTGDILFGIILLVLKSDQAKGTTAEVSLFGNFKKESDRFPKTMSYLNSVA